MFFFTDALVSIIKPSDTGEGDQWNTSVRDLGQKIADGMIDLHIFLHLILITVEDFLGQCDLPDPQTLSKIASDLLAIQDKPTEYVLFSPHRALRLIHFITAQLPFSLLAGGPSVRYVRLMTVNQS